MLYHHYSCCLPPNSQTKQRTVIIWVIIWLMYHNIWFIILLHEVMGFNHQKEIRSTFGSRPGSASWPAHGPVEPWISTYFRFREALTMTWRWLNHNQKDRGIWTSKSLFRFVDFGGFSDELRHGSSKKKKHDSSRRKDGKLHQVTKWLGLLVSRFGSPYRQVLMMYDVCVCRSQRPFQPHENVTL